MFPNSFSFFPFPYNQLDEQTEGIDTFRSHQHGPEFEDDGGISSDEGEANSEDEDEEHNLPPLSKIQVPPRPQSLGLIEQPEPQRPAVVALVLTPPTPTASAPFKSPISTSEPRSLGQPHQDLAQVYL